MAVAHGSRQLNGDHSGRADPNLPVILRCERSEPRSMNGPRCSHRGRRPSRLAFREHLRGDGDGWESGAVQHDYALKHPANQDVDGRVKPGHDVGRMCARLTHQIKYCFVMISPSRALSAMNSWMNSWTPCWNTSSMWLCSSRLRTPRAWRWAGPWRP